MASSTTPTGTVSMPATMSVQSVHRCNTDLHSVMTEHSALPTGADIERRESAFTLLESAIASPHAQVKLILVAVGSYGLGVWTTTSDTNTLCIGSISASVFIQVARQRLRKAACQGIRTLRTVRAAAGSYLEVEVQDILMNVQYCPATEVAESWPRIGLIPANDPIFNLPVASRKKLNAWRDVSSLTHTIPDLPAFRLAHQFLRLWAYKRGILSANIGYLGSVHISLMLSRLCKLISREHGYPTAADLVLTFFQHYASFNFESDMVVDPFFHGNQPRYQRSVRESLVILTLNAPVTNIAYTTSQSSIRTLTEELKRADQILSVADTTWTHLIDSGEVFDPTITLPGGAASFVKSFKSYLKIDLHFWGSSSMKACAFLHWAENKSVRFVHDLNENIPSCYVRLWPQRFALDEDNNEGDGGHRAFYLIGLSRSSPEPPSESKSEEKLAKRSMHKRLSEMMCEFTEQVLADERSYDTALSWLDCNIIRQADIGAVKLDERTWGRFVVDDDDVEEDDEESTDDDGTLDSTFEAGATIPKSSKKASSSPRTDKPPIVGASKLRPAVDILNRLRWDASVDENDYVVGYEDRFLGIREIPLEGWKGELTDDDFIPQHRIVHFKRKSDGEAVWDRERRLDKVFGSGAT